MPFWNNIFFMDANSPSMELLMFFHDHSMMIISSIMSFLLMNLILLMFNKKTNMNLIDNQSMELIWTFSPLFILVTMGFPSIHILYLMEEMFYPMITMKITGYQWYWSYSLINLMVNMDCFMKNNMMSNKHFRLIETSNFLMLPSNTSIKTLVTSNDVIHSWTIQSLGMKTDAIPGRINQINIFAYRPGTYFGQCSEICGINHSFMPIMLKFETMNLFIKWLTLQE